MSQAITPLPPTAEYVDYSAEIPGIEPVTTASVNFWSGDEGLTFLEFLDVINPLQHLPVISSIYRAVTGDEISLGARLLGGALFGGPLGILTAGINAAFEEMSGGNIAEHAAALFEELTGTGDEKPQIALEPQTAKSEAVATMMPVGPPGLPATARISPQNPAAGLPAPGSILPPTNPSSIAPPIPATHTTPPAGKLPAENPSVPVSGIAARHLRQGAMQLPATGNAPSRNSIVPFGGKPGDAATRRISQSILDGQRAQAQLLLASLSGGNGKIAKAGQAKDRPGAAPAETTREASRSAAQATALARAQIPARQAAHPNFPPSGASAVWFQQAMDRALEKYQNHQGMNRANAISPALKQ